MSQKARKFFGAQPLHIWKHKKRPEAATLSKKPRLPGTPWRGILAGCFFLFFLFGILAANWAGKEKLEKYGVMNQYYIGQLAYVEWDGSAYFGYLLKRRLQLFGMSVLSVYTRFGVVTIIGVIAWYSFSLGYLFVNALVCMGFQGMAVVLLSVFPHIFCYAAAYYGLAKKMFGRSPEIAMPIGLRRAWQNPKHFLVLSTVLCMAVGIWLESYVNPLLLRAYIQKFW